MNTAAKMDSTSFPDKWVQVTGVRLVTDLIQTVIYLLYHSTFNLSVHGEARSAAVQTMEVPEESEKLLFDCVLSETE